MTAYIKGVGAYLQAEPIGRRRMLEANGIEKRHYAIDRNGNNRDVPRDLFAHAMIHEYIHPRLLDHATQISQALQSWP